jgi:predicted nuclease of restriction endonuclease-like (RecB) superfamily
MAKKKKAPIKKPPISINVLPDGYGDILEEIKKKIKDAQLRALTAVNKELISVYWEIGKTIHDRQKAGSWGKSIVEQFAKDLQKFFPGMTGLSSRNIWRMRDLYLSYNGNIKLTALLAEISWTHHIYILEKCKDFLEREFYMRMSKRNGWTYRVLLNQIDNKTYEKTMISQTNFDKTLPEKMRPEAKLAVKDEFTFGFIDLADKHSERQLERAIVANMGDFLREIGAVYAFVGSQYRLEVDGQEFLIDILLYNRKLKALVAIELKVGKFIPEYIGKMQFYLSVLNDTVRLEDENPSIGIILCKEKNRMVVEYSLKDANKPIGVAAYKTTDKLPKELRGELPSPDQIALLLEHIGDE